MDHGPGAANGRFILRGVELVVVRLIFLYSIDETVSGYVIL